VSPSRRHRTVGPRRRYQLFTSQGKLLHLVAPLALLSSRILTRWVSGQRPQGYCTASRRGQTSYVIPGNSVVKLPATPLRAGRSQSQRVAPVVDEPHVLAIRCCGFVSKPAMTCVFGSRQFSSLHAISGAHVPSMCPARSIWPGRHAVWMQTTGVTLLAVRRCSLTCTLMLAQGSHSTYGLLYLTAVRSDWRGHEDRRHRLANTFSKSVDVRSREVSAACDLELRLGPALRGCPRTAA
jgi:hypothetical protein